MSRKNKLHRSRSLSILALALGVQLMTSCNWAGPSGQTGCYATQNNAADNSTHTFFYDGLSVLSTVSFDWAKTYIEDSTAITTSNLLSYDAQVDVYALDGAYTSYCEYSWYSPTSGGTIGLSVCDTLVGSGACNRHTIRLSSYYMEAPGVDPDCKVSLALHENLHALGLNHYDDVNEIMNPDNVLCIRGITYHSLEHLNAYYG